MACELGLLSEQLAQAVFQADVSIFQLLVCQLFLTVYVHTHEHTILPGTLLVNTAPTCGFLGYFCFRDALGFAYL